MTVPDPRPPVLTSQPDNPATSSDHAEIRAGVLTLQSSGLGLLPVALLWLAAESLLTPEVLPAENRVQLYAGIGVAIATGVVGNALAAAAASKPSGDRDNSTALLKAIVFDFALQFLAVGSGMVGLYLAGVKFPGLAAFGVAFVAVATSFRVVGSAICSRALTRRARAAAQLRKSTDPAQDPQP